MVLDGIEAVLFDLDGTLVDTDDLAVERLAHRLSPLGRLLPNSDSISVARWLLMQAETPGNAFLTLLDWVGLDEPLTRFNDRLRSWRGLRPPQDFGPIEGVPGALERLAGHYQLGLVTTRSRRHIHAFCERHPEIADHLGVYVGRQDSSRIKPHPEPLHLAARRLGVPAERCLMVGDTPVDIKAARRAGMRGVGVLCGFGGRKELQRAGASVVLGSTSELASYLPVD